MTQAVPDDAEQQREWVRNMVTIRAEAIGAPLTDKQRSDLEAWRREQRRVTVRLRRARRAAVTRLSETWSVLRHGLPDPYDY